MHPPPPPPLPHPLYNHDYNYSRTMNQSPGRPTRRRPVDPLYYCHPPHSRNPSYDTAVSSMASFSQSSPQQHHQQQRLQQQQPHNLQTIESTSSGESFGTPQSLYYSPTPRYPSPLAYSPWYAYSNSTSVVTAEERNRNLYRHRQDAPSLGSLSNSTDTGVVEETASMTPTPARSRPPRSVLLPRRTTNPVVPMTGPQIFSYQHTYVATPRSSEELNRFDHDHDNNNSSSQNDSTIHVATTNNIASGSVVYIENDDNDVASVDNSHDSNEETQHCMMGGILGFLAGALRQFNQPPPPQELIGLDVCRQIDVRLEAAATLAAATGNNKSPFPWLDHDWLVCPIQQTIMTDPVVDCDGVTYQREAITQWLYATGRSPLSRQPMRPSDLRPNRALKAIIEQYRVAAAAAAAAAATPNDFAESDVME